MTQSQARKAAFLDRDGVLNTDHGYVHRIEDIQIVDGAPEAVRRLNDAGYLVIVVTNQSGIGRGYYDEEAMHAVHAHLVEAFAERAGAHIDAFYHCPFHPDARVERFRHPDHPDRKPNPGLVLRGMKDWNVDPARSFMIGDKESDLEAARRAGIVGRRFPGGNLDAFVAAILDGPPPLAAARGGAPL